MLTEQKQIYFEHVIFQNDELLVFILQSLLVDEIGLRLRATITNILHGSSSTLKVINLLEFLFFVKLMHNILKSLPELNYMNLLRRLRFPTFTRFQSAKLFALTFLTTGYLYKQANLKIQMSEVSAKESSLNLSKYVQYSLAEYNKLQEKNDIILVVDPDRYQEEFAEEIFSLLTHLQRSR